MRLDASCIVVDGDTITGARIASATRRIPVARFMLISIAVPVTPRRNASPLTGRSLAAQVRVLASRPPQWPRA
jgi:predicted phosphoribosyltransferase